jgi:hypothetical protein
MISVDELASPAIPQLRPERPESAPDPVFDPPPLARARELAEAVQDATRRPPNPPPAAADRHEAVRQPYHFD